MRACLVTTLIMLDGMAEPTGYIRWTGHSIPFAGEVGRDTTGHKQGSGCLPHLI